MSATCKTCHGTGQLPGSIYLDCPNCDIAMIRVGLETWATEKGIVADEDELWAIFKYGESVAIEEAANLADEVANDSWDEPAISTAHNIAFAIRELK